MNDPSDHNVARQHRAGIISDDEALQAAFADAFRDVPRLTDELAFHRALAALWRAIENRRYFLRVGNAGVSGVVDPFGRVLDRLGNFTEEVLRAESPTQVLFRRTTVDVPLHDTTIPAGTRVLLVLGLAAPFLIYGAALLVAAAVGSAVALCVMSYSLAKKFSPKVLHREAMCLNFRARCGSRYRS